VCGSTRRKSLSSPSEVACQSSPSIQVTPVTKRLDSMVRRTHLACGRERVERALHGPSAGARRRLPMVEVDGITPLIGERGAVTLLDVFEGRRMLIAYYFMWH
jgi:predicted dithiol-disulfide oxidoreductase (DUF899 family)